MAPTKGFSWPKIRHFVHICIFVYIFVNVCTYHHTITLFLHHHHWKLESSTIIICHNHLLHQHNNCHHQLLWDFSVVKFSQFVKLSLLCAIVLHQILKIFILCQLRNTMQIALQYYAVPVFLRFVWLWQTVHTHFKTSFRHLWAFLKPISNWSRNPSKYCRHTSDLH